MRLALSLWIAMGAAALLLLSMDGLAWFAGLWLALGFGGCGWLGWSVSRTQAKISRGWQPPWAESD